MSDDSRRSTGIPVWELSDKLLAAIDTEISEAITDWVSSEDGDGVTIYFASDRAEKEASDARFEGPLKLCFQVDLPGDRSFIRRIDVEEIIDYELEEAHPSEYAFRESLVIELERLAAKARAYLSKEWVRR
jgi:hypothetical protein